MPHTFWVGQSRIHCMPTWASEGIPKDNLIAIIRKLLRSHHDLTFLMKLEQRELEQLVAAIREGVDGNR